MAQFAPPTHSFAQRIRTLDTTLRDGEQTPGVKFNKEAKVIIARALKKLGVDIIEAGSAINGKEERAAIRAVCEEVGDNLMISSFARALEKDVDMVVESGAGRVSLVFPASDMHIRNKLRTNDREEAAAKILKVVEHAKKRGLVVEMLAEDGSRADFDFLKSMAVRGMDAGSDGFCVCDTVGALTPEMTKALFEFLREGFPGYLAFHGHNDMGLAVANTLAALRGGADGFHGTINGLGDRAGNCALEEVAFNLKFHYQKDTVDLKQIYEISKLVAGLSNFYPARNKPLVGRGVFSHEAGIHVDGLIKDVRMYELFDPEMVGRKREVTLGKLSGKASVQYKLKEFGMELGEQGKEELLGLVKQMGEMGLVVSDADFFMLVEKVKGNGAHERIKIEEITVTTGNTITPHAYVKIRLNGDETFHYGASLGDGPVDAAYKAVENALKEDGAGVELTGFHVDAITGGSEAGVRVNLRVKKGGIELTSTSVGTDIVLVSVDAYRKALNVLL